MGGHAEMSGGAQACGTQDGARIGGRIWREKEGGIRMCRRDLTLSPGRGLGLVLHAWV